MLYLLPADQSAAASASALVGGQNGSSDGASSGSNEVELRDRALAERNFKRVNSMQRQQLGRAGDPLPDPLLPEGITPEQLFPGQLPLSVRNNQHQTYRLPTRRRSLAAA